MLVRTARLADRRVTGDLWNRAWQTVCTNATGSAPVNTYGQRAIVNVGNTYPVLARRFPTLNGPLVELVSECYAMRRCGLTLLDIGAATGDTILLLRAKCPDMVAEFYCIDGDPEFFGYLQRNVGSLPGAHLVQAVLSSSDTIARSLVRIHGGTASAQGTEQVPATALDTLFGMSQLHALDILKVDVDGYDGRVLRGSSQLLDRYRPCVIFEWHPILCEDTGNSYADHFESLMAHGYSRFVWFDKYGRFSHFMTAHDQSAVDLAAQYCLDARALDRHYDVIALPDESSIDPVNLARLGYSALH